MDNSSVTLRPGESITEFHYLHHKYRNIPVGEHELKITWNVHDSHQTTPRNEEQDLYDYRVIASPSIVLPLRVEPMTLPRLTALTDKLRPLLTVPSAFHYVHHDHPVETLRYCRHPLLLPFLKELFATTNERYSKALVVSQLYECTPRPDDIHQFLLDQLLGNKPNLTASIQAFDEWAGFRRQASLAFVYPEFPCACNVAGTTMGWALKPCNLVRDVSYLLTHLEARRMVLKSADLDCLTHADNLWVRMLTYSTFPDRFPSERLADLLADLERAVMPPPQTEVAPLIEDLDHQRFAVRERAGRQLAALGTRVVPQLREIHGESVSLDLKRRLEQVIREIEQSPLESDIVRMLDSISWRDSQESCTILQTLAQGAETSRIGKRAKELLDGTNR